MMHAQTIAQQQLHWRDDLAMPFPAPHEALIRVAYAGVNRADLLQVEGKYPPPEGASPLPGLEVSGTLMALGAAAAKEYMTATAPLKRGAKAEPLAAVPLQVGTPVCALLEGGGYAEYVTASAAQLLPVPAGWSLHEAGGLPEVLYTCWLALVETAQLQAGETALIHAGASGIGSFAIAMAKQLGARVITTASTPGKLAFCQKRGADQVILRSQFESPAEQGEARNDGGLPPESVDVILDMMGGDYIPKNFKLLKRGGRMVQLAFLRGAKAEVSAAALLTRNLRWQGITLRHQPPARKAELTRHIYARCWPWLESRQLTVPIDSEFFLIEAAKAHRHMQQNLNLGKIVLKVAA